jgi:peptide/nickel transport system substrate-binding protein
MRIRLKAAIAGVAAVAVALPTVAYGITRTTHAQSAGRTLVIGSNVAPPTLDPSASPSAAIDEVFDYNVYQHLAQLTPRGAVVPVLATRWRVSNGGKTYTFFIRDGVRFSNGDPLTPADVVFSFKRVIAPKSTYPYKVLMADVKSVHASGQKVVVTLKNRDWSFIYNLAAYSNGIVLDPKAVSQMAKHPIGTGPFMFQSEVPNYSVELVRNPNAWNPATNVSGVTFRYFANANSENSALQSGQINVIDNALNPQDIGAFKNNAKYKIVAGPTNGKIQVTINNSSGPLANVLVRRALTYATDRAAIIKVAAGGYGVPIGSGTVPGDPWYVPSTVNAYAHDVAKAKQLLKQAGYPNGFSLTLTIPPYSYATAAAPLVAAELNAVGIKTTIKNIQWPLWLSQVFTNHSFDLTIIDHVEARDIANYANAKYYWQYAGSGAVNKLLTAANAAPTQGASNATYKAIVRKITADAVNDWLYDPDQVTIAQKGVNGLPSSGRTESFYLGYASFGQQPSAAARAQGYNG